MSAQTSTSEVSHCRLDAAQAWQRVQPNQSQNPSPRVERETIQRPEHRQQQSVDAASTEQIWWSVLHHIWKRANSRNSLDRPPIQRQVSSSKPSRSTASTAPCSACVSSSTSHPATGPGGANHQCSSKLLAQTHCQSPPSHP